MLQEITPILTHLGNEDIQSTQSGMTVGGEVQIAVRAESREHLVALGIHRTTDILHATQTSSGDTTAPDIQSALAPGHVGHEIEPLFIGRYGRVRITGEGVAGKLQGCSLTPCGITTLSGHDRGKTGIGRIRRTLREIHRTLVGREAAGPLIILGVES